LGSSGFRGQESAKGLSGYRGRRGLALWERNKVAAGEKENKELEIELRNPLPGNTDDAIKGGGKQKSNEQLFSEAKKEFQLEAMGRFREGQPIDDYDFRKPKWSARLGDERNVASFQEQGERGPFSRGEAAGGRRDMLTGAGFLCCLSNEKRN